MSKNILLVFIAIFLSTACNNQKNGDQPQEAVTKLKVYCDEAFYNTVKSPVAEFDSINYQLKIELIPTPAFDCMANLLSGNAQAVILSREYSKSEDSLMKAYNVPPFPREAIAHDALVFYTNADVALDTISDVQLRDIFTNPSASFEKYYPKSGINTIVCNSHLSSEYYNLKKYLVKDKKIAKNLKFFSTVDSVKKYVQNNKNSIGIGYLSQLHHEADLKAIQVSFIDSTGRYQYPMSVHQANIVRGFYPYRISHYLYIYDSKVDAASAFLRYICKNGKAQRHFNEIGIVPAYGQIRLIEE